MFLENLLWARRSFEYSAWVNSDEPLEQSEEVSLSPFSR